MNLTPYDKGTRAEPQVWPIGAYQDDHPDGMDGLLDSYGKVDFDDDESSTIATIWLERTAPHEPWTIRVQHNGNIRITIEEN